MFKCPDKLSVHLSRLGYTQAASLYFPKSVLEDATGLVGLFQLLSEFLQLVHILLHVHIPHLQHLRAELLHFILKMQSKIVYVHNYFIQLNHMYYSHYNCSKMEVFDWKTWGKWMHSTSVVCTKGVSYIAISVSLQPTHPRQQWPHILSASMLCVLTHRTRGACQEWRIAFLNALVALSVDFLNSTETPCT